MGFDEWYLPKKHFLDDCESGYFECYEAGAASRQAEIDDSENTRAVLYRENMDLRENNIELQKRIDEALVKIQDDCIEYGISDSLELAIGILKGESNE